MAVATTLLGAGRTCGEIHPPLASNSQRMTAAVGASQEISSRLRLPNNCAGVRRWTAVCADDAWIGDPMLDETDQPTLADFIEKGSNIRVKNEVHLLVGDPMPDQSRALRRFARYCSKLSGSCCTASRVMKRATRIHDAGRKQA
jgi:hypothetical protein